MNIKDKYIIKALDDITTVLERLNTVPSYERMKLIDKIMEKMPALQGEQGEKGEKGESLTFESLTTEQREYFIKKVKSLIPNPVDGKTPVKGRDYFTEEDKDEIIENVKQEIKNTRPKVVKETKIVKQALSLEEKQEILDLVYKQLKLTRPAVDNIVRELEGLPKSKKLKPDKAFDKDTFKKYVRSVQFKGGFGGGSGSSGGVTSFTGLTDVPSSYTGDGGKFVKVKAAEDGLEFVTGSGGSIVWGDITGTLANQTDLQDVLDTKSAASVTITAGTGLTGGGTLNANMTFSLANTSVTPASYTVANITVDAQGRVTTATSNTDVILKDGSRTYTNAQSMGGFIITNLGTATNATDAVSKAYIDAITHSAVTLAGEDYLSLSGQEITANKIDLGTNTTGTMPTTSLPNPVVLTSAASRQVSIGATDAGSFVYLGSTSNHNLNIVRNSINRIILGASDTQMLSELSLNSNKITDLATPTLAQDAVTKAYVDSISYTSAQMGIAMEPTASNGLSVLGQVEMGDATNRVRITSNSTVGVISSDFMTVRANGTTVNIQNDESVARFRAISGDLLISGDTLDFDVDDVSLNGSMAFGTTAAPATTPVNSASVVADIYHSGTSAFAVLAGADESASTRTNNTNKIVRIGMPHYTNNEEPVGLIVGESTSTNNIISIGGGSSAANVATRLSFYVSASTSDTTGTEALRVRSDGSVRMSEVYEDTVGATNRDLYIDQTGNLGYLSSSIRYKENVNYLEAEDISWLYQLNPTKYTLRKEPESGEQYGLIAEHIEEDDNIEEEIKKYLVSYNSKGEPETVVYSKLITPLLQAIQDQKRDICELQKKVAFLEKNNI